MFFRKRAEEAGRPDGFRRGTFRPPVSGTTFQEYAQENGVDGCPVKGEGARTNLEPDTLLRRQP